MTHFAENEGQVNLCYHDSVIENFNDRLPPVHPGEVLLEDFTKPSGLSQYRVAKDMGVSPIRISQIIHGQRSITVDTAMRLGQYFGTSAEV